MTTFIVLKLFNNIRKEIEMNIKKVTALCLSLIMVASMTSAAFAETRSGGNTDKDAIESVVADFFEEKEESFVEDEYFDTTSYYIDSKKSLVANETSTKLFEFERLARASVKEDVSDEDFGFSINNIDITDAEATVEAFEWYEYTYQNDVIRSSRGTTFKFKCSNQDGDWKFVDIQTDNEIEGLVEDVDDVALLFEGGIEIRDEMIEDDDSDSDLQTPSRTLMETHDYDRSRAATYALQYSDSSHTNSGTNSYNSKFKNYAPNDCQNFVSQCVWYGLGGTDNQAVINNRNKPMITSDGRKWYGRASGSSYSWIQVGTFRDYVVPKSDNLEGIYGVRYAQGNAAKAQKGDAVQICDSSGTYYHTYIVSGVTGTYGERTISNLKICAHTCNRRNENLGTVLGASCTAFRVVRINGTRY